MSTTATLLYFAQCATDISLFGGIKIASLAIFVYYVCTKTRATAIFANLIPSSNYRCSVLEVISNDILITLQPKRAEKPLILAHGTKNMLEMTPHAMRKPFQNVIDWGYFFPYVAQSIRARRFNFTQVLPFVQKDPLLERAIKQSAEKIRRENYSCSGNELVDLDSENEDDTNYQTILIREKKRALKILRNMGSKLNNALLAVTSWLMYNILPCFLSGVVTHTKQIEMLKAISERSPGTPLIFVPLHRSHLDYIMVTFILTNNDIRAPLVAAGNNLQIPVFGGLLRGLGAFFIKRKIDPVEGKKDVLYRAALHLYITHALKLGHNIEFFIEGGRTRTGKPCMPKGGILSVIVNAFMDGNIPDALLVPVSVNYERLVDGNFVCEQRGEKKAPETFWKAISGIWKALRANYGLMRIDFIQPYSIKDLVYSYNSSSLDFGNKSGYKSSAKTLQHNQSTSSLYGTDVVCEEHRHLIESISRQIVYDCAVATSVMSTNALAFLLLNRFRDGAEDKEIALSLDEFRETLREKKDIGFSGDSLHVINYACDLLGPELIMREIDDSGRTNLRISSSIDSYIELAYYANVMLPYFAPQAILLVAFHHLLNACKDENDETPGVVRSKLMEAALEICDIFRYEFILNKPAVALTSVLERTIDDLCLYGFFKLSEKAECESAIDGRRIAKALDSCLDESDNEYDNIAYNIEQTTPDIFLAIETIDKQYHLCAVLAPLGCTYMAVARHLCKLQKNPMIETDFIISVVNEIKNSLKNGNCLYAESLSTDTIRNCLKMLEKWSVIEFSTPSGIRKIALNRMYDVIDIDGKRLESIVQRISATLPNLQGGYFSSNSNLIATRD